MKSSTYPAMGAIFIVLIFSSGCAQNGGTTGNLKETSEELHTTFNEFIGGIYTSNKEMVDTSTTSLNELIARKSTEADSTKLAELDQNIFISSIILSAALQMDSDMKYFKSGRRTTIPELILICS